MAQDTSGRTRGRAGATRASGGRRAETLSSGVSQNLDNTVALAEQLSEGDADGDGA